VTTDPNQPDVPGPRSDDTSPPTAHPPSSGYELYRPRQDYLWESRAVLWNITLRATAHCVVQWSDTYLVREITVAPSHGKWRILPGREGALPSDAEAKHAFLEELFAWETREREGQIDLMLKDGDRWVLWDWDSPFSLHLQPTEIAVLQDYWEAYGFPRDLFYPASQPPAAPGSRVKELADLVKQSQSLAEQFAEEGGREEQDEGFAAVCEQFNLTLTKRMLRLNARGTSREGELEFLNLLGQMSLQAKLRAEDQPDVIQKRRHRNLLRALRMFVDQQSKDS
jgi:hypothetical protein